MQSELNIQTVVSKSFSQNVQTANQEINQYIDELKTQLKHTKDPDKKADIEAQINQWQNGQVLLNAIASGLSTPSDGVLGIATATAAPEVSYRIGQYFKEKKAEGTSAHILAHAILGAAVAAAGDNNALAGAISAGGAEVAAPVIGKWLFGKERGSDLTAGEKETVSAITNLLGTAMGASIGNTTANAVQGGLNAQSALRNNTFSPISIATKGRRTINLIRKGKSLTFKDVLPVAEAGIVVVILCKVTGNCDASEVWDDLKSGKLEDDYTTSESANSQNKPSPKQTSSTIVPDTNTPMPDPDFEPEDDNKKTEVYKPKDNVERAIKDASGKVRGYKNKGAGEDVRTVTPAEFDQIKSELMKSVQGQPRQLGNNGLFYQTKDGGRFSIRQSTKNGETIDIINAEQYGLPKSFRIHKQ